MNLKSLSAVGENRLLQIGHKDTSFNVTILIVSYPLISYSHRQQHAHPDHGRWRGFYPGVRGGSPWPYDPWRQGGGRLCPHLPHGLWAGRLVPDLRLCHRSLVPKGEQSCEKKTNILLDMFQTFQSVLLQGSEFLQTSGMFQVFRLFLARSITTHWLWMWYVLVNTSIFME